MTDADMLAGMIEQTRATAIASHSCAVISIAFNSRGGLHYPVGSSPVALRIAKGNYRNGKATPYQRGDAKIVFENRLQIGRVIGGHHRID